MTTTSETSPRIIDLSNRSTLSNYSEIAAAIGLRKFSTYCEELPLNGGASTLRATSTAVISNPWAGNDTTADLAPEAERIAPLLAKLLTDRLLEVLGGAEQVEAFGKAALVGVEGETEHAGAMIHTPYFGNLMREALDGTSILCFADGHGQPGEKLRIPMWHKTAPATRSHYQTIEIFLSDAPAAGEIAIVAAASTGPRPFARIGDRLTDKPITSEILKEIAL